MPELPEVETVVCKLHGQLVGRHITAVVATKFARKLRLRWNPAWNRTITERSFSNIWRRGKWLILDFTDGGALLGHLGMSGQLAVVEMATSADAHGHLDFRLN